MRCPERSLLRKLLADESGAAGVEYGMILTLIFLIIIGAVTFFANKSIAIWADVAEQVSTV